MTLSELAWLKYPAAVVALLVVFAIVGLPLYALTRRRLPPWGVLLTPIFGISIVAVLFSWYGRLGLELYTWLAQAVVVFSLVVSLVWAWRSGLLARGRSSLREGRGGLRSAWGVALPWVVGVAAATAFMTPMVTSPFIPAGYITVFTTFTADVGAYVAEATNVQRSGFDDAGLFYGWNAGSNHPTGFSADQDHTGANALLAFSASVLGSEVWKIGQVAIMLLAAALVVATTALARSFMPTRPRVAVAIGTFAATTFMVWYLVGNFFFAQVMCLGLATTQLALVTAGRDHPFDWRIITPVAVVAAATWLGSPEFQLVVFLFVGALILADLVSGLVVRSDGALLRAVRGGVGFTGAVLLAGILVWPFLQAAVERSQRVYNMVGGVGWELDLHDGVLYLIGFPAPVGGRSDLGALAAIGAGLLLLAAVVAVFLRRDRRGMLATVFCAVLIGAVAFGASRWGWSGYQGWKLLLSVAVPFVALATILVARAWATDQTRRGALVAVLAALVSVNVVAGARMWEPVRSNEAAMSYWAIDSEIATFLDDPKVQAQERLNIFERSPHGTMIIPVIFGKKAALSTPSYISNWAPGERPYACSLVEASLYKKSMGRVVYANHGYLLVDTPRCS